MKPLHLEAVFVLVLATACARPGPSPQCPRCPRCPAASAQRPTAPPMGEDDEPPRPVAESDGQFLDAPPGASVRLAYVTPPRDTEVPRHAVVRAIDHEPQVDEDGAPLPPSARRKVVLRHELRWLELLRGVALSLDRSQSAVLSGFVRHRTGTNRDFAELSLQDQIRRQDRGQPFADGRATANRIIGLRQYPPGHALAGSWLQLQTGELADQAYYLEERDVAALERLARAWDTTPGQVADMLISIEARRLGR